MIGGVLADIPASAGGPAIRVEQWKPGDIVATLEFPNGVRLLGAGQTPQDAFDAALGKLEQTARDLLEPPAPRPGIRPLLGRQWRGVA